jgi:hypothetical protein
MLLETTAFIAGIILIACAIIGGLAWVCRSAYTPSERENAAQKAIAV